MKWNIPEKWVEIVNLAVVSVLFVGVFYGFGVLSVMGYFIYVLSFYEDLPENESVASH